MTVNELIRQTLAPVGLPVVADQISSEFSQYIAFNYVSLGDDFGDDAPQHERYLLQIHLFALAKTNTVAMRQQMKKLLFEAGFTFPTVTDASDSDGQHWVFECELGVPVYG